MQPAAKRPRTATLGAAAGHWQQWLKEQPPATQAGVLKRRAAYARSFGGAQLLLTAEAPDLVAAMACCRVRAVVTGTRRPRLPPRG